MSNDYYIAQHRVCIPMENIPAINTCLTEKYGFVPVGVNRLTHMDALSTAAAIEHWTLTRDADGNVVDAWREVEYDNFDDLNWLRSIAPWVGAGSYVEVVVEHDYCYRVMFDGQCWQNVHPTWKMKKS